MRRHRADGVSESEVPLGVAFLCIRPAESRDHVAGAARDGRDAHPLDVPPSGLAMAGLPPLVLQLPPHARSRMSPTAWPRATCSWIAASMRASSRDRPAINESS